MSIENKSCSEHYGKWKTDRQTGRFYDQLIERQMLEKQDLLSHYQNKNQSISLEFAKGK